MHSRRRSGVFAALTVLAIAHGAHAQHHDAATADAARRARVVAHVAEREITVGELEDMLNEAPAPVRQAYAEPARRREFLENLIGSELLAGEARRRGIDRQPETAAALRRVLAQQLERHAVLDAITMDSVTADDVRAYYAAHVAQYQQPEYRRATVLFADTREVAEQLASAARATHGDMRRVIALVRERSTDQPTREHDGDAFYFQRNGDAQGTPHALDPALAAAAFGLARETDVTAPVHVANGKWGVAVLTGIRPALSRGMDDVSVTNSIRGALVRQRRDAAEQALRDSLRERLHPEMHPERLDLIHLPPSDLGAVPPFGPGGGVPRRPSLVGPAGPAVSPATAPR